jgi:hypothetical protein
LKTKISLSFLTIILTIVSLYMTRWALGNQNKVKVLQDGLVYGFSATTIHLYDATVDLNKMDIKKCSVDVAAASGTLEGISRAVATPHISAIAALLKQASDVLANTDKHSTSEVNKSKSLVQLIYRNFKPVENLSFDLRYKGYANAVQKIYSSLSESELRSVVGFG